MTGKRAISVLLAGLALAVLSIPACRPSGDADEQAGARSLVLVVSGDTKGWIMPCGCASNQSGGLPRRGAYVNLARKTSNVIVADVGGAPGGTSQYDRVKFASILAGEVAMGLVAHNLGSAEIRLGPDELRRLAAVTSVPLVSANTVDAQGRPIAQPMRVATIAGYKIAFVGVVSPRYATDLVRVSDPRAAVVEALALRSGQYDTAVVLAYTPTDELESLAVALPEVDIVVGGPTLQSIQPHRTGPKTLLASATNKGKFLARFDAPRSGSTGTWRGQIVELDDRLADDPAQLANLEQYKRELTRLDLPASETGFVGALALQANTGLRIAGTESCRKCHEHDGQSWDHSRHAHAWSTLVQSGWQVDCAVSTVPYDGLRSSRRIRLGPAQS